MKSAVLSKSRADPFKSIQPTTCPQYGWLDRERSRITINTGIFELWAGIPVIRNNAVQLVFSKRKLYFRNIIVSHRALIRYVQLPYKIVGNTLPCFRLHRQLFLWDCSSIRPRGQFSISRFKEGADCPSRPSPLVFFSWYNHAYAFYTRPAPDPGPHPGLQ